jgi:CBS domain containing-hemolysin-like protein
VIAAWIISALLLGSLLAIVTFVQMLYLESLRLRTRESPSFQYFKEHLEERIGQKTERGALTFSLVKHLSVVALGLTCLGIASGGKAPTPWDVVEGLIVSWLSMIAACYIVPQVLYRKTAGHWMRPLTPILRLLVLVIRPVTMLFEFLQSLAELGQPEEAAEEKNGNAAEQIEALITAGTEEGLIEEDERKLIQSVVAFGRKTVREVMTPRPNIVAIEAGRSLEELRDLVINEQYSRIPVYETTIDNVIGFIHVRDMFELDQAERKAGSMRDLVRPVRFVPETKPVDDLLREMQQDGAHVAIVIDEYGSTAGLVTMEDLVEEILGEIRDEHEPGRDVAQDEEGRYIVSGSLDLDRLEELLSFRPQEETESTTVGGLVTEWMGRVPEPGETVEREGIRVEVLAGNGLRVEQVRVSKSSPAETVNENE